MRGSTCNSQDPADWIQKSFEYFRDRDVHPSVKINSSLLRLSISAALLAFTFSNVSCMTTYDAYGRPVETVDPDLALAGIAAAGLIGYAAANHHSHKRDCHEGGGYGGYHGGYGGYSSGGYYRPCY